MPCGASDIGRARTRPSLSSLGFTPVRPAHPVRTKDDRDGQVSTYDSGDHRIGGVAQADGTAKTLTFTSQDGDVDLGALKKLG